MQVTLVFLDGICLTIDVQKLACATFKLSLKAGRSDENSNNWNIGTMQKQNLFVGSLAYSTDDDALKAFFEQVGEVERAKVATDRDTGRSRGFGFVTFVDDANNQKAVDELNGKELDGRAINVSIARPREDKPRNDSNGGGNSFRKRSW